MSFSPDESPSDLWLERSTFVGGFLGAVAYGILLTLFFITAYYMLYKPTGGRISVPYLIYIIAIFSSTTVNVGAGMKWNEMAWTTYRNYPGGPAAFQGAEFSNGVNVLVNSAFVVTNFLADGLVLYRLLIIWQDRYLVVAFPFLMFLASTALSIITLYEVAQPGASLWTRVTVNFAVPYWSLSISLNIIVTLLIAGRLLVMRRRMRDALGSPHAKKYTSVVAMLIESAALYSITGIVYIITYARNSNVQNLVLPVLCSVMSIAPLLILLRVASGNGFSRKVTATLPQASKMSFASPPTMSHSGDSSIGYLGGDVTQKEGISSGGGTTLVGGDLEWNKSKSSGHQLPSDV